MWGGGGEEVPLTTLQSELQESNALILAKAESFSRFGTGGGGGVI